MHDEGVVSKRETGAPTRLIERGALREGESERDNGGAIFFVCSVSLS